VTSKNYHPDERIAYITRGFNRVGKISAMSRYIVNICLLIIALAIAGCSRQASETLTVLAGSELKDVEPLFGDIQANTGIRLDMHYIGTLDGAERLLAGEPVDLAWFSHAKYLELLQGSRVAAQEKVMLSPVIMGVKESKARAWGWIDNPDLTWRDIAAKAGAGELRYAMTNPTASNSGFTALVGVAAALAGSGDALQKDAIDHAALRDFFKGQRLTAGSSGWLADSYVKDNTQLDGIINYESVLMQLNDSGKLREKLYLIYPREGIITADYPLMLINPTRREAYQRLVDYLRTPEFQKKLMNRTLRRPVIPQVQLSNAFPQQLLVEVPFPSSVEIIDYLLFAYLDEQRIPSHAFFVLDVSGSMRGNRLNQLKEALINLTGRDRSLTGQFARFRGRERITLITFNDQINAVRDFEINDTEAQGADMRQIRHYVNALSAGGGTAIFDALQHAYELAEKARAAQSERYYSIVLMSDGENRSGLSERQFLRYYRRSLPSVAQRIKTFTVLFGDADVDSMTNVAGTTGGRVFDSQKQSLSQVFKHIRGYQ